MTTTSCSFEWPSECLGGVVTAMALNKGVLLGFISSGVNEILLKSRQFDGRVRFRFDDELTKESTATVEEAAWGNYARGAVYALIKRGYRISKGIYGVIDGLKGLQGAGISSSAAVGVSILLALEHANGLNLNPEENIHLDRSIENDFLGLKNGILDQSAILLSRRGCLTVINCKEEKHKIVRPRSDIDTRGYKVLLAFSGLRHALSSNSSYNLRVSECQEAALTLLRAVGRDTRQPLLSDVHMEEYQAFKTQLKGACAKRAEHFFSECERVRKGIKAWEECDLKSFGRLMSESGGSSIENYECGCEPMIQLLEIVQGTPGVFGARFSGAGFRGCCVALIDACFAEAAAKHIELRYKQVQPLLAKQIENAFPVLICDTADHAYICLS
ncbi:hypothetical protein KP509_01G106300 [Ceratopteris richardii]|uniref:GHMP kinase N-terminal domain-containing protein n=1 Tax=Ceratopteris richardii TaxID=49495 RepID=A0A8T2VSL0_CERRI|nr:hypothetical protein KP509_01G106300 [Ceratopteris richardii]